jgi:hypothetical protein
MVTFLVSDPSLQLASGDKSLRSDQSILFDATLRSLARYRRENIRRN